MIGGWATNTQAKELEKFVSNLRALDGAEVGMIVALATRQRHILAVEYGWFLLDPFVTLQRDPGAAITLNALIRAAQRRGQEPLAAGMMVWLHSLRAMQSPELRQGGRDLWRQLQRGFPYCDQAQDEFYAVSGEVMNLHDHDQIPIGLTPDPK